MLKSLTSVEKAWALARSIWDHDYPDFPWISQPLRLSLQHPDPFPRIRTLFGGLERLPQAAWEFSDGRQVPAVPTIDPEGWVEWGIECVDASPSNACALILLQSSDAQDLAQCVVMQQDPATDEWVVTYNTLDRARSLQADLWKGFESHDYRTRTGLLPLLDALIESRHSQASALLESDAELQQSASTVHSVLARFQMEWNSHGLKRTFRFWSLARKQSYLEEAAQVMNHLRSISDGVCLGFGGVLGWRRDGGLIDHDDDLDVLVAFDRKRMPDLGRALRQVECELRERGCVVKGRFFAHLWVQLSEYSAQTLDVFVGLIEDSTLSFYPSRRGGLQCEQVLPAVDREILGVALPMPADPDAYLTATYGAQWMTPERGFAHPWDREQFADIAGHRARPPMWTRGELSRVQKHG